MEKILNPAIQAFIIDDEVDICFLLRSMLKLENIDTTYVNTLKEAKVALDGIDPRLIFLDNNLPDGLGVNFISYIKSTHPRSKIVMITAYDTEADRSKAVNEGADYFIGKPFTREKVTEIVGALVA